MQKIALIVGTTGQDGAYLAHYLLNLGYHVVGTSRDAQMCDVTRLDKLGIKGDIELVSLAPNDFRSVLKVVSTVAPHEIYNLSGQTSVGLSFEQPVECMESISNATLNLLEVIRYLGGSCRFFNAGSSECFGEVLPIAPASEQTPFHPRSPYAVAKAASFWQTSTYREAYGLFACTGILANHESPLRPRRFVTQKIISSVKAIKNNTLSTLQLGNLDIWRDWGWAHDYVKAMHLMLQAEQPNDYLVASGVTTSLRQFVEFAFEAAELKIDNHLESHAVHMRPADITFMSLNPALIDEKLGWSSERSIREIVHKMYREELF